MQFILARINPRYSIDRAVVGRVLAFGLPIAAANLLSWALLNVDNVVLARVAGATLLGYYVLAFNISGWPMSALSQVVRSISLPYFSRAQWAGASSATLTAIAWAGALPVGAVLAALSVPLIEVLYGAKWLPAAPVLAALGLYGSIRVVFDIFAGYLYSQGRSRPVLWVQIIWLVALTGGMIFATRGLRNHRGGLGASDRRVRRHPAGVRGGALARPAFRSRPFLASAWWPTVATIPSVAAAMLAREFIPTRCPPSWPVALAALAVYAALIWPWLRRNAPVDCAARPPRR